MLTFFRRLRKGLLGSGQARKYLIYAIGEILLVMIGILLALQVNNWNEWRKDRDKETKLLEQIVVNLESVSHLIRASIGYNNLCKKSSQIILTAIETVQPYHDSLDIHFHYSTINGSQSLFLSNEGYESLKTSGFELIQNELLVHDIVHLFEFSYPRLLAEIEYTKPNGIMAMEFSVGKFFNMGEPWKPVQYEKLIRSDYYKSLLLMIQGDRNWNSIRMNTILEETQRVLQLIKDELRKKE